MHDTKLLKATIEAIVVDRPETTEASSQHLCLDKGYDYDIVRAEVAARGSVAPIRARGEDAQVPHPDGTGRRWVVERTHSWINRSRRLLARWEKQRENYLAFVHLACAQRIFHKRTVSG